MPNQLILSMQKIYPFGQCYQPQKVNRQVLVRKLVNTGNKQEYIAKAKQLKKLKVPHSIQIISIFQDLDSFQIYYEYVPVKFQIWMKSMSDQLSDNLIKQLYVLTTFLAQNRVWTSFNPDQLGLDKQYHIKYFLDLQSTFLCQNQNPSELKQKYYRQISYLLKLINQNSDRNISNPLFSSINSMRTEPWNAQIYSSVMGLKTLQRAWSLGGFQQRQKKQISLTESLGNDKTEIQLVSKQSALKKIPYKLNFNEKLKNIKQKLQNVRENGSKNNFSVLDFQKHTGNKQSGIKKTSILKKSVKDQKFSRGISIEKIVDKKQKASQQTTNKKNEVFELSRNFSEESISYFKHEDKKNKSQKFKTPKNSESPIEYLDIVKSASSYVQDFLNVLEDPSESQQYCFEEQKIVKQGTIYQKSAMKTQESQEQNEKQQIKWQTRFYAAIQNSKKLIDRMKSPPKVIESIAKM